MVTFTFIVDFVVVHFPSRGQSSQAAGGTTAELRTRHSWPGSSCIGQSCSVLSAVAAVGWMVATLIAYFTRRQGARKLLSLFFNALSNVAECAPTSVAAAAATALLARHHVVITKSNSDWDLPQDL